MTHLKQINEGHGGSDHGEVLTFLIVSDAPGLEDVIVVLSPDDVIVVLSPDANQQLTTDKLPQLIAWKVSVQTLHDNLGVVTDDGIKAIQIVLVLFRQPTAEIETALGGCHRHGQRRTQRRNCRALTSLNTQSVPT